MLCVILVVVGIETANRMTNKSYEGATTIFVRQSVFAPEASNDNYKFDGYYAVMANQTFADSLENWIKSPEIVVEAYKAAEMDYPRNMSTLANRFEIDKVISQSVAVRASSGNPDESEKLLNSLIVVLKQKVEKFMQDQNNKPIFTIDNTPILVLEKQADYRIQYGIGILGAVCLGLFLTYFIDALKEKEE